MSLAKDLRKEYTTQLRNRSEGQLTKKIENQTARLPSDAFLFAGIGGMLGALTLKAMGRDKDAQFVGQWVPTFLLFGVYNKLVKLHGND